MPDPALDAFDTRFADAAERLHLFLRVRTGQALRAHEDSFDLLQETYLAARKAFGGFEDRGDGAFVRWLCRIAENCVRARADHHGAQKRRPPAELERVSQLLSRIAAGTLGPATRAERQEQRERLASGLAQLPREEREVFVMRHFEGLELDAIASRIGSSATSVRRLLGRASLRLGEQLAGRGEQS
ncbi:MAG: sigma-70 family RNA polymerase sigma factor [Planctomycetes bacterium]|nr:sigma-70 family RNA polymerase sigma factor [Planctomycetota bacterium]MCB9886450.1 sigma-70 family RNA polymerase sigma factor [Planctomycetota bacterium]